MLSKSSSVYHAIIILSIVSLILPNFSFGQQAPQTINETKAIGENILSQLPAAVKKIWQEEAWPFFKDFFQKIWGWIWPKIEPWWQKKKPILEQELQKETQEMKQDLPNLQKAGKSLWEKFKELIK